MHPREILKPNLRILNFHLREDAYAQHILLIYLFIFLMNTSCSPQKGEESDFILKSLETAALSAHKNCLR